MSLPPTFSFSQTNLQDYQDCPRRFQLRYLLRQPWPAVESEPLAEYEALLERGRRFHQLAQQYQHGLAEADLAETLGDDPDLRRWWRNYLQSPPPDLPVAVRRAEWALSTPVADPAGTRRLGRLGARYDLLALEPGRRAVVVDWKTSRRRPNPDPAFYRSLLQTRVYRYVLVRAGTTLNGGVQLQPEQVTMIHWFAEYPADAVTLPYDQDQYRDDEAYLADLMARIVDHAAGAEAQWPLTPDERHCRFCTYRSLCGRDVPPGRLEDFDADQALDLSVDFAFEEVEEIAY
jgi:hypothetical protein